MASANRKSYMSELKKARLHAVLSEADKRDIKQAFDLCDTEKTGKIDISLLEVTMRAMSLKLTAKEMKKMVKDVDPENSGTIDFSTYLAIIAKQMGEKYTNDEDVLESFRRFDKDDTGKISFNNLKSMTQEAGENLTDEQLQAMIAYADRDGDGEVSLQEFRRIMMKPKPR